MSGKARPEARMPDLGRLDICLNVKSVKRSMEFYRKLGFRKVEGVPAKGWAVLAREEVRIGLFHGFITENTLNFRGGDIRALVGALRASGLKPYNVNICENPSTGNTSVRDPDGNVLFFDTTAKERAARKRARAKR